MKIQGIVESRVFLSLSRMFGVWLTYKRLLLFCYECGVIGHSVMECELAEIRGETNGIKQYGDWLRAASWNINNGDRRTGNQRKVETF